MGIGAILQMIIGIGHFFGTFYSELLHPKDKNLIQQMKNTLLNVDIKATQWNAWLFFNIAFSVFLFMVGFFAFVLAYQNFEMIKGFSLFSISIILSSILTIYFAHKLVIRKVRTVFILTTLFYIISILLNN